MNGKKLAHHATPPVAILISILMLAGTILSSEPKESVLHRFRNGGNDGLAAYGRVISDSAGISTARPLSVARLERASFSS